MNINSTTSDRYTIGERTLSSFEKCEILFTHLNFLVLLSDCIGTQRIKNGADIPVIMRTVGAFAVASKTLYNIINKDIIWDLFLKSMAERFKLRPLYFALNSNFWGCRRWLWNTIEQHGYRDVFKKIFEISNITREIVREVNVEYKCNIQTVSFSIPSGAYSSKICLIWKHFTVYLSTPLGQIVLFQPHNKKVHTSASRICFARLLNRLDASFEDIRLPREPYFVSSVILCKNEEEFGRVGRGKKISSDEINIMKGSHCLIRGNKDESLWYTVQDLNFTPHDNDADAYRIRQHQFQIWEMLKKDERHQIPWEFKIPITDLSNSQELRSPRFKNIEEIARKYACYFKGIICSGCNRVGGNADNELKTLYHLHDAAKSYFIDQPKHELFVEEYTSDRETEVPDIFTMKIYRDSDSFNYEQIYESYLLILNNLGREWKRVSLKDYPQVKKRKSEEEYTLFIHNNFHHNKLLNCVELQQGVKEVLLHDNKPKNGLGDHFLWIRNDCLKTVCERLGIP